jgi:hypothetical protein
VPGEVVPDPEGMALTDAVSAMKAAMLDKEFAGGGNQAR